MRKKVRGLIEQKVAGQEITAPRREAPKAQIVDLMEALKASLAAAGTGRPGRGGGEEARPPSPRKPAAAEEEEPWRSTVATAGPRRKSAKR